MPITRYSLDELLPASAPTDQFATEPDPGDSFDQGQVLRPSPVAEGGEANLLRPPPQMYAPPQQEYAAPPQQSYRPYGAHYSPPPPQQ